MRSNAVATQSEPFCQPPETPTSSLTLGHILMPAGVAISLLPGVSAGLALLLGLALALTTGNPFLSVTRRVTHRLLALAVIGLGASMDLRAVLAMGIHGVGYTLTSITCCFLIGLLLVRLLRVNHTTGLLITVGTAICGGSAIAAMVPVLRPREDESSVALATVFLLNALALFAFPAIGHVMRLEPGQFGLWSALAIHDTSSVIGAAMRFGPKALEVATIVKLTRALWIVPLTLAIGAWHRRAGSQQAARPKRPWFILGFLAAAAIVTFVPVLRPAGLVVAHVSKQALVVTLFLIGAGLTRGAVRTVGLRPLVFGVGLWLAMAAGSLGAIVSGLLR